MASSASSNVLVELQGNGDNQNSWDTALNAALTQLDEAIAGREVHSTTGGDTTLTLTQYVTSDGRKKVQEFTGTLSSNARCILVSANKITWVVNNTTPSASETFTVKTSTSSEVTLASGQAGCFATKGDGTLEVVGPIVNASTGAISGYQTQGDVLDDLNSLGAVTQDGEFLVGTGAGALAWESGATARTSLGLGTSASPQFTGIQLGHASDTTLTRSSAGRMAVEGSDVLMASDEATASDYYGDVADKILTTDIAWDAMAEQSVSDAASISWDMSTGIDFTVTLAGNRTLSNATNTTVGKKGRIRVVQDGTGSRTLSFGTSYEFAGGTAVTLSTGANDEDVLYYDCISSSRIVISSILDIS